MQFFLGLFFLQEKSNKEIDLIYKLKVLQQELEQEEASHKTTRALLADKSKIKVTIEGAKSESMKGKGDPGILLTSLPLSALCSQRMAAVLVLMHACK